mmetsp:Transcript_2971/g.4267  ORF Transcript_2971/g.4267 Transcript_2971/m.4267 type:complete len:267 (-) Transcript_2971:198-998(-)
MHSFASRLAKSAARHNKLLPVALMAGSSGIASTNRNVATRYASDQVAASTKESLTMLQRYEKHLQASPVKTKMVTGSILWGLGDLVAQVVPQMVTEEDDTSASSSSSSTRIKNSVAEPWKYDAMRTARAVFFGFALHAPLSHLHFNFLEYMTVRLGVTGAFQVPIFKAVMEQFVYWSWVSNALYHGAMGAMQGMGSDEIYQKLKDVLWETQKAQWVFWIPVQLLNFRFVPVRHQLNVVLCTSVVWTALLSAWYPPEVEDAKKEEKD